MIWHYSHTGSFLSKSLKLSLIMFDHILMFTLLQADIYVSLGWCSDIDILRSWGLYNTVFRKIFRSMWTWEGIQIRQKWSIGQRSMGSKYAGNWFAIKIPMQPYYQNVTCREFGDGSAHRITLDLCISILATGFYMPLMRWGRVFLYYSNSLKLKINASHCVLIYYSSTRI